jgi:hypothetical protein
MHRSRFDAAATVALCVLVALLSASPAAADIPPHTVVAYHDSWDDVPAASPAASSLATLPGYVGVVDMAFARPDLAYRGNLDLSQTGLEYRVSGRFLRDAIAMLRVRHPATKVLLSVGGAAYGNWHRLNEAAVAHLVHDLDLDGVDIDFEPQRPACGADAGGSVHCATDALWPQLVQRLRAVLPRPALLTASVWSVGAYGEGRFRDAQPHSDWTGLMLHFLRSPAVANLDMLAINAYDAGPDFDPMQAFRAYRALWPGPLALGLAVQRNGGSGPFLRPEQAELLARRVAHDRLGAMMVYPLLARPEGARSDNMPDGRGLASAMCRGMALAGCDDGGS